MRRKYRKNKIKLLPVKLTIVNSLNRTPHIRKQHFNPFKDKNEKYVSQHLLLSKNIHKFIKNEIKNVLRINPKKVYYVGGLVRDSLMYQLGYYKRKPKFSDIDLVIEKPTEEDIEKLENHLQKTGKFFPVFRLKTPDKHYDIEITLARKERKIRQGYKGFEIYTGSDVSIEDDLKRRDLTINAIAVNLENPNKIIDPFGGLEDLKKGILRHVSPAFAEDPLRVLKVARFSARFNFDIAPETLELMKELVPELKYLTKERVRDEIFKTFKQSNNNVSRFFVVLDNIGGLEEIAPRLKELQNYKDENGETYFDKSLKLANDVNSLFKDTELTFTSLYSPYSKIIREQLEELNKGEQLKQKVEELTNEIKERFKLKNTTTKLLKDVLLHYNDILNFDKLSDEDAIKLVETLYKDGTLDKILKIASVDKDNKNFDINLQRIQLIREIIEEGLPEYIKKQIKELQRKHNPQRIRKLIINFYLEKLHEKEKELED